MGIMGLRKTVAEEDNDQYKETGNNTDQCKSKGKKKTQVLNLRLDD